MTECNVYRVLDKRDYRGHPQGTEFAAHLDNNAARRAIARGSIELIGTVTLRPETYTFPDGWLPASESPDHRGRESGLSH